MRTARFKIGTTFMDYTMKNRKDVSTVVDIYTKTNTAGQVIDIEYLCQHVYMGQKVNAIHNDVRIAKSNPQFNGQPIDLTQ